MVVISTMPKGILFKTTSPANLVRICNVSFMLLLELVLKASRCYIVELRQTLPTILAIVIPLRSVTPVLDLAH
jgi:hypothetical protein